MEKYRFKCDACFRGTMSENKTPCIVSFTDIDGLNNPDSCVYRTGCTPEWIRMPSPVEQRSRRGGQ